MGLLLSRNNPASLLDVLIDDEAIDRAIGNITPHVMRTPLVRSHGLSGALGTQIHAKCELFQPTGSFKVRGVHNIAADLTDAQRAAGLIAFSAGNHAMAVAHVATQLGLPVTVCMPAGAVQFKVDAVTALGASVELVDGDLVAHVMERQAALGATLVHPFDDPSIVAGTATIGREIIDDLPDVDTVIVPVGGGGLISGVAAALKRHGSSIRVIGVEPDTAAVITASQNAGHPVSLDRPRSLADGLAAPITGEINLAHIHAYVDEMVVVDEASIGPAWWRLVTEGKLAGEPASAVGIAAISSGQIHVEPDEKVCLVVSGGNADFARLKGD